MYFIYAGIPIPKIGVISFRRKTRFVSDFSREKIDQWNQCVAGHENLKRNETQKNSHADIGRCGGSHPHASPPGRTRDFRTMGAAPGGSQYVAANIPLASRSIRSRSFFVVASEGLQALSEKPVSPQRCHRRNLRSPHTRGMPELLPDRKLYLMNKWKPLSGRWLSLTRPNLSNEISNRPKPAALRARVAAMNGGGGNELKAGRLHLLSLRF